jgi:hypothetical protein
MNSIPSYLVYAALVVAGLVLWLLLLAYMRGRPSRSRQVFGWSLIGPVHVYLSNRGYSLSKRELFGWGAVFLLMLAAPLISWLLEHS